MLRFFNLMIYFSDKKKKQRPKIQRCTYTICVKESLKKPPILTKTFKDSILTFQIGAHIASRHPLHTNTQAFIAIFL